MGKILGKLQKVIKIDDTIEKISDEKEAKARSRLLPFFMRVINVFKLQVRNVICLM